MSHFSASVVHYSCWLSRILDMLHIISLSATYIFTLFINIIYYIRTHKQYTTYAHTHNHTHTHTYKHTHTHIHTHTHTHIYIYI